MVGVSIILYYLTDLIWCSGSEVLGWVGLYVYKTVN